jgi:hypothetical protein
MGNCSAGGKGSQSCYLAKKTRGSPLTERAIAILLGIKAAFGIELQGPVFKTTSTQLTVLAKTL